MEREAFSLRYVDRALHRSLEGAAPCRAFKSRCRSKFKQYRRRRIEAADLADARSQVEATCAGELWRSEMARTYLEDNCAWRVREGDLLLPDGILQVDLPLNSFDRARKVKERLLFDPDDDVRRAAARVGTRAETRSLREQNCCTVLSQF